MSANLVVGIDIGGTKTAILVSDPVGRLLGRSVTPTPLGTPDTAADVFASFVERVLAQASARVADVSVIGVGVPGRVEQATGHVSHAVNLDWRHLPLRDRLEARLGVPTVVENDVRAAALGLHRRRVFGPVRSLALLAVGTGISAGVVLDGGLHRGAKGLAGEIGHVVADPDGPRCACGNVGCLEAVAAGPAIVIRTLDGWDRSPSVARRAASERLDGAEGVFAAAAAGDQVARDVVDASGRAIGWAIHLLALAYDVERIVIGGGVSHAGEPFMAPIRRQLDEYRAASPLSAEILSPDLVQLLPPGADAGAWGAVMVGREALEHGAAFAYQERKVGHA